MLTQKNKDVYCVLSTSRCADYGLVKERIIKAYELVPKDYLLKKGYQTHIKYSRVKQNTFSRWLQSMKV